MYDAIIVGAGPAGNVAALRLSSKGHRVAVLDWRFDIGDKLCTGIVGTECGEAFPIPNELIYRQANSATFIPQTAENLASIPGAIGRWSWTAWRTSTT